MYRHVHQTCNKSQSLTLFHFYVRQFLCFPWGNCKWKKTWMTPYVPCPVSKIALISMGFFPYIKQLSYQLSTPLSSCAFVNVHAPSFPHKYWHKNSKPPQWAAMKNDCHSPQHDNLKLKNSWQPQTHPCHAKTIVHKQTDDKFWQIWWIFMLKTPWKWAWYDLIQSMYKSAISGTGPMWHSLGTI